MASSGRAGGTGTGSGLAGAAADGAGAGGVRSCSSPLSAICSAAIGPRLPVVDDLYPSQAVENRLSTGWRCL
ncbi:hypothetical protein GCM10010253_28700 [Streptomyces badius]|uniref:Uncharacterized protein n=1 Tax=Streptomyces badius TaxID=1941 RepID=A0ABQ2T5E8_STRBA|nr:hypothetical protein GCM10010253_28700 [Streptomyces badius]